MSEFQDGSLTVRPGGDNENIGGIFNGCEGSGDGQPLFLVIWRRNTFEGLQPLHSGLSTLGLVRHHTTNCTPEDLSGSTEVEGSTQRLDVTPQTQKLQVLQLVAVEVSAHVDAFGSDDDNLVTVQDEFGDDGGQTAHQVATAIDYHRLKSRMEY